MEIDYKLINDATELRYGLYILKRGDILDTNIYKIGKTERSLNTRHNEYMEIGTKVLFFIPVNHVCQLEQILINQLKNNDNIIFRSDYGNEYFEGEYDLIKKILNNLSVIFKVEHNYNIDKLIEFTNNNHKPTIRNIISIDKKKDNSLKSRICKRCGLGFNSKSKLLRHLNNLKPCQNFYSKIDINAYIQELKADVPTIIKDGKKLFICKYCKKEFKASPSKCVHQAKCKLLFESKNNINTNIQSNNEENIVNTQNPINNTNIHNVNNCNLVNNGIVNNGIININVGRNIDNDLLREINNLIKHHKLNNKI